MRMHFSSNCGTQIVTKFEWTKLDWFYHYIRWVYADINDTLKYYDNYLIYLLLSILNLIILSIIRWHFMFSFILPTLYISLILITLKMLQIINDEEFSICKVVIYVQFTCYDLWEKWWKMLEQYKQGI